jgi:DNA-binding LytR/AlgR family response regulator
MQPDVEIVGVCSDGPSAVETIERAQPDLVFLDVQMPGMDGFEVIENLDPSRLPSVVFVTAHDGHAIRAFEIHALDFLLKPFDQTRFEKALERARSQVSKAQGPVIDSRLVSLLEELREERKYPERLIVKSSGRVFFVRTEEIDWVEASGNYVKIHTKAEAHLQSIMGLQTLNAVRSLDFLLSLPEVDAERVAITGASGGGTQTFMLCAIDDRPAAAFPAVMVGTAMQGGCICENCSYLRVGTGNVEIAGLFAPKPLGMSGAKDWTIDIEKKDGSRSLLVPNIKAADKKGKLEESSPQL